MIKTVATPLSTRIAFAFLWLFVFTLPLTQATEIPAIGTISKAVGLLAIAAGAAAVIMRGQIRVLGAVHWTMAALIGWSAITLCWSVSPDLTIQRIMTYLELFMLVLLIWEFCAEEKDVLKILGAFVLGTMFPALSTLQAFLPGQGTLAERASTAGYDSSALAFQLTISLPVAYYLIMREKSAISALYRLQMGFAVCAVLLSGSAAAIVAMVIGLSLVCRTFHMVPVRTRLNAFAFVMLMAGGMTLFVPSSVWNHFSEESKKGGITFTTVVNNTAATVRSTPMGGLGAGSLPETGKSSPIAPASTLPVFSETGVIGAGCFIVLLGALLVSAERMSGISKSFWYTVLAVTIVGICALHAECSVPVWLLFGLLASHAGCQKKDGVTQVEQQSIRNYYIEESAEVWS